MAPTPLASSWIAATHPKSHARMRLFCFPYAGGGAALFREWILSAPPELEILPIALPGREGRFKEPPFTRLPALAEALALALQPLLRTPFAFFGHSMGALISFELARSLRRAGVAMPIHLFVSGHRAPQLPDASPAIHQLPSAAFFEELRRLNGTPAAALEHVELMELMEPILRADFELCETYVYSAEDPLALPISAFSGAQDPEAAPLRMDPWRQQTSTNFLLRVLPGDHFFVQEAWSTILHTITQDLRATVGRGVEG